MTGMPQGIDDSNSAVSTGARGRQLTTMQKVGVAGLVLAVTLSFIWLRQLSREEKGKHDANAQPVFGMGEQLRPAPLAQPPMPSPTIPMPAEAPAPSLFPMPAEQAPSETAASSAILAYAGGGGSAPTTPSPQSAAVPAPAPTAAAPPAESQQQTALSARLHPTVLEPTKARLLPHPDFLLTKGTMIPCILQTAINTQLAGFVKCVTPADTRSTTGNVVLLDKGTLLVGEIEHGLQNGENRVFVLWDRAETPDHAIVTLASPGTDELGRSGLPGAVDTHFWDRFGSAIMLSVIQTGLQAGSNVAGNSNSSNGVQIQSFQSNGQELANTALVNSINIPPTLEKNQGDDIAIFVARDLDFSDIYSLRRGGRYAPASHAQ
jgi:type IV secretion system protein VirB10